MKFRISIDIDVDARNEGEAISRLETLLKSKVIDYDITNTEQLEDEE